MTTIEWARNEDGSRGKTWNPVVGCSLVSPGCTNCYAMGQAARLIRMNPKLDHYAGLTQPSKAGPVWTGVVQAAPDHVLTEPLRRRKPTTWFVCSMADLFHEDVPDALIDRVFAVMALCPQHTFQVLTKRPERMREYFSRDTRGHDICCQVERIDVSALRDRSRWVINSFDDDRGVEGYPARWPLPNVWLGVTAEDQTRADERIPELLATPAAVRFVSYEPALGPVDFTFVGDAKGNDGEFRYDAMTGRALPWGGVIAGLGVWLTNSDKVQACAKLDWIICGGESGNDARPMHPDWARNVRDQCQAAGVPFFFKQWGAWAPELDRDADDPDWRADYSRFERNGFRILNQKGGCGFHGERVHVMRPGSKKSNGRLLDGRTHDAMPSAKPAKERA